MQTFKVRKQKRQWEYVVSGKTETLVRICGQCMWSVYVVSGEVSGGQSAVAELASGPRFGPV